MNKRLVRSTDRKIAGVCGGIAEYLNIDPVIIRILFFFLIFAGGSGFILYLIFLLIMPEEQNVYTDYTEVKKDGNDPSKQEDHQNDENQNNEQPQEEKKQEENKCPHSHHSDKVNKNKNNITLIIGIIFIFTGTSFLFRNFFPYFRFQYYFPVLLILMGAILLIVSIKPKK
ncbi:MAG: PspC domain-containing protein [Bacteroidales bacterium]